MTKVSRRSVLKSAAATGLFTSAIGLAPRFIRPAFASGFAPGMTGGPQGFPGAVRFQYNESHSEGRAIEGAKKLVAAGKAPAKITILMADGAIGQITKPYPDGAPSVQEVWERETGIKLEIVGAPVVDTFKRVLQDVTTSNSYDLYMTAWNNVGDLVDAGGVAVLDDFVAKYKPDWTDPDRGTMSPESGELLYKYNGHYYMASIDGDYLTWIYNRQVYEDPKHQAAFSKKYGYALAPPSTWQQSDNISEYFTGQTGIAGQKMFGSGAEMSPFWGVPRFYARFVSQAMPNMQWFDSNGNPNLDTPEGIRTAEEYLRSRAWSSPDALSWSYAEGYAAMGAGTTAQLLTWTNVSKFQDRLDSAGKPATPMTGGLGAFMPIGRKFGDKTLRRSVIYYNITGYVAAHSQYQEATYLLLQWLTSTRTYSWMAGNPGGYFDPFQKANFDEELVQATYHKYMTDAIQETIKRAAPTINFPGQAAFDNALDEELQAMLAGQKGPEQAMKDASKKWKRIIQKKGEDKFIPLTQASAKSWPTIVDTA